MLLQYVRFYFLLLLSFFFSVVLKTEQRTQIANEDRSLSEINNLERVASSATAASVSENCSKPHQNIVVNKTEHWLCRFCSHWFRPREAKTPKWLFFLLRFCSLQAFFPQFWNPQDLSHLPALFIKSRTSYLPRTKLCFTLGQWLLKAWYIDRKANPGREEERRKASPSPLWVPSWGEASSFSFVCSFFWTSYIVGVVTSMHYAWLQSAKNVLPPLYWDWLLPLLMHFWFPHWSNLQFCPFLSHMFWCPSLAPTCLV